MRDQANAGFDLNFWSCWMFMGHTICQLWYHCPNMIMFIFVQWHHLGYPAFCLHSAVSWRDIIHIKSPLGQTSWRVDMLFCFDRLVGIIHRDWYGSSLLDDVINNVFTMWEFFKRILSKVCVLVYFLLFCEWVTMGTMYLLLIHMEGQHLGDPLFLMRLPDSKSLSADHHNHQPRVVRVSAGFALSRYLPHVVAM